MEIPILDKFEHDAQDMVFAYVKSHDMYYFPLIPTIIGLLVLVLVINANIQVIQAKETIGDQVSSFAASVGCPCENMAIYNKPLIIFNQTGQSTPWGD